MNSEPAEAVNAEPPATPEPAAPIHPAPPMPRVSDDDIAYILTRSVAGMGLLFVGITPSATVGDVLLDLRDARGRESALRAKVAELEARIAHLTAVADVDAMVHRYGSINDPSGVRAALAVNVATMERNKAVKALARANEALSAARFQAFNEALDVLVSEHIDGTEEEMRAIGARLRELRDAARAQGSAAQKMEGPQ